MTERTPRTQPGAPQAELRQRVREGIHDLDPSLRVVAEDILGLVAPIDLVALDAAGHVVLVLIGAKGEDRGLLTRALAQRSWLKPRLRDWAQLAPSLGIRADAPIRVVLLAPDFDDETRAAVANLRPGTILLARYLPIENAGQPGLLLEPLTAPRSERSPHVGEAAPKRPLPAFRSGLSERDLRVSPEEARELE